MFPLSQAGTCKGTLLQEKSRLYLQLVMGDEPEIQGSPQEKVQSKRRNLQEIQRIQIC